jgi:ankyrin repeat protein
MNNRYNNNPNIMALLLNRGLEADVRDEDEETPLFWAVAIENLKAWGCIPMILKNETY